MSGQPVPSLPVCRFDKIESFRPGYWNGEHFTPAFINQAVANFEKYSAGPRPWYRPYVSINHDKTPHLRGLKIGRVQNPTVGADGILRLDAINVPEEIGVMRNTGMLSEPSIEFIRPKIDPKTGRKTGFVGPDGRVVDGPLIKCLTFLGADVPAVHGMSELPTAVFCFTGGECLKFSYGAFDMQTRDQMIQALAALGLDAASIPPEIPDEFLSAVLTLIQNANAAAKPVDANPQPQFADAAAGAMAALGGGMNSAGQPIGGGTGGGSGLPMPTQIITKFALDYPGFTETLVRAVAAGNAQTAKRMDAYDVAQKRAMDKIKDDALTSFFSQMGDSGQVTPDMAKTLRPMLMGLDNVTVSTFAVGGKDTQTTAFDAKLAEIRGSYPVIRNMDRKVTQPPVTPPNTGGGTLDQTRMAKILGGTGNAHGNAALKRLKAS